MERLLTGLIDFSIKKVVSLRPICLEVPYNKDTQCPECHSNEKRIKCSFWREIKSIPQLRRPVTLLIRCHVITLINHHLAKTCKHIDEENLAWKRGGLIRAMSTKNGNLAPVKEKTRALLYAAACHRKVLVI